MQPQNKFSFLKAKKAKPSIKSWYQDKSFNISLQRNILAITSVVLFLGVILSLVTIKAIVEKKAIEPYVIKVSKQDQIPISVDMQSVKQYAAANQGVLEYFLIQYITSRESYNFETYLHDYNAVVRRMSTYEVFRPFWENVNNQADGIIKTVGKNGKIDIVIKQIALEPNNNIVVIRMAKRLILNGRVSQINHFKIKMHYLFDTSNLTYKDIVLNPLGLKIDFYEAVEERAIVNDEVFSKIL